MQILAVVAQAFLALAFLMAGGWKVVGAKQSLESRDHLGVAPWFWRLTGFLEVAGALGLLVGIFVPALATLAGIGLACALVGAFYLHVSHRDTVQHVVPVVVLFVLALVVVAARWSALLSVFSTRA